MISIHMIGSRFQVGHLSALLEAVSPAGIDLPLPLRARLLENEAGPLGLALRHVMELTYGPTALSRDMTVRLLALQGGDGSYGGDPLATAVAAAAIAAFTEQSPHDDAETPLALRAALTALAGMQGEDGLFCYHDDRTLDDRELVAAFILLLLANTPAFRQSIRFADLMTWFEVHEQPTDPDTGSIWRMARTACATPRPVLAA